MTTFAGDCGMPVLSSEGYAFFRITRELAPGTSQAAQPPTGTVLSA